MTPRLHIGIPDRSVEHGSRDECLAAAGLDPLSIAAKIERWRDEELGLKPPRTATKLAATAGLP